MGKIKGEGARELDGAMNGAMQGHGVYRQAWVGVGGGGGRGEGAQRAGESPDYNMIISVYLPDSID